MTLGPRDLVVLDTNVLVNLARDNVLGRRVEQQFHLSARPERPLISSVTRGEIGGLSRWWGWGQVRLDRLEELLDELVTVDAGRPEVIEAYSNLYARSLREGHPMGENDLWIAATCVAGGAQLITHDTDFDWLHPSTLTRHWHALPDGWEHMQYRESLEERRRRIARVIRDGYSRLARGE